MAEGSKATSDNNCALAQEASENDEDIDLQTREEEASANDEEIDLQTREEEDCATCKRVADKYRKKGVSNVLTMHIDAHVISTKDKQKKKKDAGNTKERKNYKDKLLTYVCALRNSGKGILLLDVMNQNTDNWYHGWLDRQIDVQLNKLIEDGSLFGNVYTKYWEETTDEDKKKHSGILVLYIRSSSILSTLEYNTYFQTDEGALRMQLGNIKKFFKNGKKIKIPDEESKDETTPSPILRGKSKIGETIYESRITQFKHLDGDEDKTTIGKLMNKVWNKNLSHLGKYISAFAKQDKGGSFYFGIRESFDKNEAKLTCSGVNFEEGTEQAQEFQRKLENKLNTLLIFSYEGVRKVSENLNFYEVGMFPADTPGNWILEVAVCAVSGIVFTEKPESYIYRDGQVYEYGEEAWIKRLLKDL